ncbi:hypothetical protein DSM19430T_28460 [Desulfovibrio psychrotolerans]|uniref:Uncharacterized protein n=1 Tax=Desulfovibrio psychrotolerans TaxID=415242 RepID=A0A7J0BYA5_9BACT|nr:hypothetical protein DSM19430T_28460 [Desulfovibrio psychrotolerans]
MHTPAAMSQSPAREAAGCDRMAWYRRTSASREREMFGICYRAGRGWMKRGPLMRRGGAACRGTRRSLVWQVSVIFLIRPQEAARCALLLLRNLKLAG